MARIGGACGAQLPRMGAQAAHAKAQITRGRAAEGLAGGEALMWWHRHHDRSTVNCHLLDSCSSTKLSFHVVTPLILASGGLADESPAAHHLR